MESDRDIWLWIGGAMLLLAAVAAGIAGAFLATREHFQFWTSPEMIAAYIFLVLAAACLLAATNEVPFPPWSDRVQQVATPLPSAVPISAPVTGTQQLERIIVDVTPAYLMSFFDKHMSINAHRLLEPYLGKWMRVAGELGDVGQRRESFTAAWFASGPNIALYFRDAAQIDRLSVLQRGTPIVVLGKIDAVRSGSLDLEECELEEVGSV